MREKIDSVARRIRSSYEQMGSRAQALRGSEPSLIVRVERAPMPLSVCAVDGGLLSSRMHGADIAVVRAVGVNFRYDGPKLSSFSHHPQKSPEPELELRDSLDEHESLSFRSLVRLRSELGCAIECVAKYKPDAMLMDGSLLPLPNDRPPQGSALAPLFDEVLSLYLSLQKACRECMLCGVIKDSRSRKLSQDRGFSCSDGVLCGFLLEPGERTKEMPYHDEKPKGDMAEIAKGITVFYLKPSQNDLPLRIEIVGGDASRAASLILGLCAVSENYAYPAILVEADMCAALDGSEMESIESSLLSLTGMRPLRRNSRPFR